MAHRLSRLFLAAALLLALASCARKDDGSLVAPGTALKPRGSITLGEIVRTALSGCDNPTPVRAPNGAIYSNVSDCTVGTSTRISTGWVQVDPFVSWMPNTNNLTTTGNG